MDDPWYDVDAAGCWLAELEEQWQPHVIHLNNYGQGNVRFRAPVLTVAHSCVYSWWNAVKLNNPPQTWRYYRRRVSRCIEGSQALVAPTRAMLACMGQFYSSARHERVIHNGCDVSKFAPGEKENFILGAGRIWDEAKNIDGLCHVAGQLPWPVKVAGNPEHPDGGVSTLQGVELLGQLSRERLREVMSRARIYCLPARYEPFGLSILEAALCGCALVVGDIPSLREVWGDAAVYVPPGMPAALRHALIELIQSPSHCRDLGEAARAHALQYTDSLMARRYRSLYDHLLHHHLQEQQLVRYPQQVKAETIRL